MLSFASPTRRRLLLQRLAWLCAALMLVVASLSAFIRQSRSEQGCEPWPQCQGIAAVQVGATLPEAGAGVAMARMGHRVVASATLLLVLAMVGLALSAGVAMRAEARLALGLLGLVLFLALLGVLAGPSRLPAVTLGNLLAGFAMCALSVRLALMAGHADAARSRPLPSAWLAVATALAWAQVALGGMVSAGEAGLSCPALRACDWRAGSWQALDPWALPAGDLLPGHAAGALVHMLHRWSGMALTLVLLVLAWQAWRLGRRAVAAWLVALPLLLVVLGLVQVWLRLPLPLVLVHNTAAALLLALLSGVGLDGPPDRNRTCI